MIASLTGRIQAKSPGTLVLLVGGVGFKLSIPLSTWEVLPEIGNEVTLQSHLHVQEKALDLIGFATDAEREVFELLISVSGVGVKLALTILSGLKIPDLLDSISREDKSLLGTISGVGPKTAGRLILELREKIGGISAAVMVGESHATEIEEAILALEALGISRYEAKRAVETAARQLGDTRSSDVLIREALKATA